MRKILSNSEARNKIDEFFKKDNFVPDEVRKIKRLANKHRISLKPYKSFFCRKCLSKLKGKIRISKTHKSVVCQVCNHRDKFKIN